MSTKTLDDYANGSGALHCCKTADEATRLIAAGACVQEKNASGETPLHSAAVLGDLGIAATLVAFGAHVDSATKNKKTALFYAAASGAAGIVALLIKKNALVDFADTYGYTPLCIAAENGKDTCVQLLLDAGADINHRTAAKNTPLHIAASECHTHCVKLLLKAGADQMLENDDGDIPRDVTTNPECKKLLKPGRGASPAEVEALRTVLSNLKLAVAKLEQSLE